MHPRWRNIEVTIGVVLAGFACWVVWRVLSGFAAIHGDKVAGFFSRIMDIGSEEASFKQEIQGVLALVVALALPAVVARLCIERIRAGRKGSGGADE